MRTSPLTFVLNTVDLVLLGRLVERCPPERQPGVVEEDVDAAELLDRLGDEAPGARRDR